MKAKVRTQCERQGRKLVEIRLRHGLRLKAALASSHTNCFSNGNI